jgi:hypothetical protein
MKTQLSSASHGDYQQSLYEAPSKSMPVHSSRSPYRTQGDARCQHCGVYVWESDLQMKHGVLYHKACGRKVRLRPFPCTLERLKRKNPKKHFGTVKP